MTCRPAMGAIPGPEGTTFRLWAPSAREITLVGDRGEFPLAADEDGFFTAALPSYRPGDRYRYRVDGKGPFPDPASRFQPLGVHGPSHIVSPAYPWTDASWPGLPRRDLVFYELHVGTFSPEGTFDGARRRLGAMKDLGITAVELMPVADFPGRWNWGYDGVALFAPARCYGTPEDLRRLVDEAHGLGLAVFLDVVYNHFGPNGNHTGVYSPFYVTDRHQSPWGAGINLDGEHSGPVRDFFIENALHWIDEYHMDGLRLDATHAMEDEGPRHFLAELADRVHAATPARTIHLIAEDSRNLAVMVRPKTEGGWGLDGVWADDLHHHIRRALAGDTDGYFADFSGTSADMAETLRKGWFFCGQRSGFSEKPRGTDPAGLPLDRFVVCLQNHDQVGNRAMGDRLHHTVDLAAYRAAAALLLFAPELPLLFMGQEWGATSPFQYFTDHTADLGRLVTQGRREEFKTFKAFSSPELRERIPDPQDPATFERSRLRWEEVPRPPHGALRRYHKALLSFRRESLSTAEGFEAQPLGDAALVLRRGPYALIANLKGSATVSFPSPPPSPERRGSPPTAFPSPLGRRWGEAPDEGLVLSSEDARFCDDPHPISFPTPGAVSFSRAGAVILDLGGPHAP